MFTISAVLASCLDSNRQEDRWSWRLELPHCFRHYQEDLKGLQCFDSGAGNVHGLYDLLIWLKFCNLAFVCGFMSRLLSMWERRWIVEGNEVANSTWFPPLLTSQIHGSSFLTQAMGFLLCRALLSGGFSLLTSRVSSSMRLSTTLALGEALTKLFAHCR